MDKQERQAALEDVNFRMGQESRGYESACGVALEKPFILCFSAHPIGRNEITCSIRFDDSAESSNTLHFWGP